MEPLRGPGYKGGWVVEKTGSLESFRCLEVSRDGLYETQRLDHSSPFFILLLLRDANAMAPLARRRAFRNPTFGASEFFGVLITSIIPSASLVFNVCVYVSAQIPKGASFDCHRAVAPHHGHGYPSRTPCTGCPKSLGSMTPCQVKLSFDHTTHAIPRSKQGYAEIGSRLASGWPAGSSRGSS